MVLESKRLILRGWRDEDAPSLFKYASDERVGPAAGWEAHKSVAYSRAVIRTIFNRDEVYAICLKGGGNEPIGSIGLTFAGRCEKELSDGECELGYWVGVPFWGRGIASEAASCVINHAFCDLKVNKIYCGFFEGNEKSKRVQEKCGFVFHHTNPGTKILQLGEKRVEHVNVLTFSMWQGQNLII